SVALAIQKGEEELGKLNDSMAAVNMDRFTEGFEGAKQTFKDLAPIADTIQHPFSHMLAVITASGSAIENMKATVKVGQQDILRQINEEATKREAIAEVQRLTLSGMTDEAGILKAMLATQEAITESKKQEADLYQIIDKIAPPGTPGRDKMIDAAGRMGERSRAAATSGFEAEEAAIRRDTLTSRFGGIFSASGL